MNKELEEARRWAYRPKSIMYFLAGVYGGLYVAFLWLMILQGRWREVFNSNGLIIGGWAIFAVVVSCANLYFIEMARRTVKKYGE